MSNIFEVKLSDVFGAVVSAIIVAVLMYLTTVTNITDANWQQVLNVAFAAGVASLLQALGTDAQGAFLGVVKVK